MFLQVQQLDQLDCALFLREQIVLYLVLGDMIFVGPIKETRPFHLRLSEFNNGFFLLRAMSNGSTMKNHFYKS